MTEFFAFLFYAIALSPSVLIAWVPEWNGEEPEQEEGAKKMAEAENLLAVLEHEGCCAYRKGVSDLNCPYATNSHHAAAWQEGWRTERRNHTARKYYEEGRKDVSGRPPWEDLDHNDPYDLGMIEKAYNAADAEIAEFYGVTV